MKYDPIMCMMVDDSVKTEDESYVVRGRKYKVIKRDGDNVTVKGPDGKITNMHIDFLMNEGKKTSDEKTLDHSIRSCDSREDDIADELFDALQQIGKRNINKNEAEFISEKFFDGKVSSDELMRIFNKYKKEYL